MTANMVMQGGLYLLAILALAWPLGRYMARVYDAEPTWAARIFGPAERLLYRLAGIDPQAEMDWKKYAGAVLVFNAAGFLLLYAILRLQAHLPLNPQGCGSLSPALAFNTAVSFVTNTNWQAYTGEAALSYFSQMIGLTVQNFLSAATGMAVLVALIRGIRARAATAIGNFWADLVRGVLYVLLPLSLLLAVLLVGQGVVQSLDPYVSAHLLEPVKNAGGDWITTQTIPLGPAASQVAIKQLGTNGGGFFGVNSAHPFENPTPL
ncbi:MAG: potassium-transporting ATPase subunit KdpA, partial [Myxococcales bacterium]|nr:potassium-transporting ATPase subunit KdpA [Myxococcales bacterium]